MAKVVSIFAAYILAFFLILCSVVGTMLTLSGSAERELGWDPYSSDILKYLVEFQIPSLSLQFFGGLLVFIIALFLNFRFRKHSDT